MIACRWIFCIALLPAVARADAPSPEKARAVAFEPNQVWEFHLTIPAGEFEAMQPRGGFNMFGPPVPKPKTPEKPIDPKREVHKNTFGVDLPWAVAAIGVAGQKFENV